VQHLVVENLAVLNGAQQGFLWGDLVAIGHDGDTSLSKKFAHGCQSAVNTCAVDIQMRHKTRRYKPMARMPRVAKNGINSAARSLAGPCKSTNRILVCGGSTTIPGKSRKPSARRLAKTWSSARRITW